MSEIQRILNELRNPDLISKTDAPSLRISSLPELAKVLGEKLPQRFFSPKISSKNLPQREALETVFQLAKEHPLSISEAKTLYKTLKTEFGKASKKKSEAEPLAKVRGIVSEILEKISPVREDTFKTAFIPVKEFQGDLERIEEMQRDIEEIFSQMVEPKFSEDLVLSYSSSLLEELSRSIPRLDPAIFVDTAKRYLLQNESLLSSLGRLLSSQAKAQVSLLNEIRERLGS